MEQLKNKNIVCYGEVLWDMLPSGAKPGGAPLNVAVHLKYNGLNPCLISSVGTDLDGKELIYFLNDAGVDTQCIQIDSEHPTSQVIVHLDSNKNASYEICEPVAWDNIQPNNAILEITKNASILIYGSLASRNKITRDTLFQLIDSTRAIKLLDVNLRSPHDTKEVVEQLLYKSDFIKLNDDELITIASWNNKKGSERELLNWITEFYHCSLVCVTRGANGAILFYHNLYYEHPGFKVEAVDTVGAGDSFLAALLASLINEKLPQEAIDFACATGAFVASKEGATPKYQIEEIEQLFISD